MDYATSLGAVVGVIVIAAASVAAALAANHMDTGEESKAAVACHKAGNVPVLTESGNVVCFTPAALSILQR